MAHRSEFYLYRRHKKKGDYWYVCFLDRETGKAGTARSIDVLKERLGMMDFSSVRRKEDAAVIAHKALEKGLLERRGGDELFASWCSDFWDWDKSEYILLKNRLKPGAIGREYAYNMKKNFEKNVKPLLPQGLKLSCVTVPILDRVVKALYKSGKATGTVSIIIYSFSLPLKEAMRLGYIALNPAERLLKVSRSEKSRGAFTKDEVKKLRVELENERNTLPSSVYYGILLALVTGMRMSEIRALNVLDIVSSSLPGYSKIIIRYSVAHLTGLKSTKGKYERALLITDSFASLLKGNASPSGILIASPQSSEGYISMPTLRNAFYAVLEKIGISNEERRKRNLSFHSLRHTFSTLGRDCDISKEDRMLVLGHRSERVNDRYTHATDEALYRVSVFTEELLSPGTQKSALG